MKIPDGLAAEMAAYEFVCGSDEVGVGSWAGPLVVCAAVLPRTWSDSRVTDSKKLTARVREQLAPGLATIAPHCIMRVDPQEIDARGIGSVLMVAHAMAIQGALKAHAVSHPDDTPIVIIDGSRGMLGATALPKADLLVPAVSAASIIAKVFRDRIMQALDLLHPGYGWTSNSGYGTPQHQEALQKLGVTAQHRMSYAPMSKMGQPEPQNILDLLHALDDA